MVERGNGECLGWVGDGIWGPQERWYKEHLPALVTRSSVLRLLVQDLKRQLGPVPI